MPECTQKSLQQEFDHPTLQLTRHAEKTLVRHNKTRREFTFGVLADTHIFGQKVKWKDDVLRDLLQTCADAGSEFIMVAGDLGEKDNEQPRGDGIAKQAETFVEVIDSIEGCPAVFMSVGNHELDVGKAAWLEALYPSVVTGLVGNGNDRFIYYAFDYCGCHLICLDGHRRIEGANRMRGAVGRLNATHFAEIPDEQFEWLEEDLEANRGKLTFVFMHEPTEQIEYNRPWHMLRNRGRLIGVLSRYPDVKWLFHGHTHHHSQVKAWGLNICHVGNHRPQVLRVHGEAATIYDAEPHGKLSEVTFFDLDALHQSRLRREADRFVYGIAEDGQEENANSPLLEGAEIVAGEDGVTPPRGQKMIRVHHPVESKKAGEVSHHFGYLTMDFIIEIKEGMKFSYDVYFDSSSAFDNFSLSLIINTRDGGCYEPLRDGNGILMDTASENPLDAFYNLSENDGGYHAPSLLGKANARWYHRECDLSPLAGGWIVGVLAIATPPKIEAKPGGYLKFYLSTLVLSWPVKEGALQPSLR